MRSFKQRKSWAVWISKRSVGRFSTDGNDGYGSNFYGFPSRLVPAEIVWFYAKKHDQLGGCFSPTHHKGSALMNFSFRSRAMVSGVIEFPMFFSEKNWRLAMRPSSMVFGGNPIWLWSASRSLASGIQRVAVRAARLFPCVCVCEKAGTSKYIVRIQPGKIGDLANFWRQHLGFVQEWGIQPQVMRDVFNQNPEPGESIGRFRKL